jgi:hypothetical protein
MQHLLQILAQNPKKSQRERHTEVTVVLDRYTLIIPVMQVKLHIIFAFQIPQKDAYAPDDDKSANERHSDHTEGPTCL